MWRSMLIIIFWILIKFYIWVKVTQTKPSSRHQALECSKINRLYETHYWDQHSEIARREMVNRKRLRAELGSTTSNTGPLRGWNLKRSNSLRPKELKNWQNGDVNQHSWILPEILIVFVLPNFDFWSDQLVGHCMSDQVNFDSLRGVYIRLSLFCFS